MGTLFSLLAIGASIVLVLLPVGSWSTMLACALLLLFLAAAALLRARAGYVTTAAMTGWLAIMIAAPFSITVQQGRALQRLVRSGDEAAAGILNIYTALEPFAPALMVIITLVIAALVVLRVRRAPEGAFPATLKESEGIATLLSRIGIAAAMLYVPMIIIIVYDVVQRQYLGISPQFTNTRWYGIFTSTRIQEMQWHLHAILFLLCLAYGYVKDAHVRIELLREGFTFRRRAWIELLGCLLFLVPYCYIVMNYGIENAQRSFSTLESSAAQTGLAYRFIIKGFLPLGFGLLALAGISVALKCVVYLFGPAPLSGSASSHLGTEPIATSDLQET